MRISEEIDALEVMGVPSLPYLVTTRMIAAFIAVIPLYIVALSASYLSPRLITTMMYGQSSGTYDHYFIQFLPPRSEEHTSELQSLMRISYAVFCLKKKSNN